MRCLHGRRRRDLQEKRVVNEAKGRGERRSDTKHGFTEKGQSRGGRERKDSDGWGEEVSDTTTKAFIKGK